jgi:epoxyqueuosine reductase QueG
LTPEAFAAEFERSPINRPGLKALQRNARICITNAQRDQTS